MEPPSPGKIVPLLLLGAITLASAGDLVVISPQSGVGKDGDSSATPTFYISAKSHDLVVRGGDTVDLTCHSSEAWHLCSWMMPSSEWCHRLSHTKYDKSCPSNSRVRFQVRDHWLLKISGKFGSCSDNHAAPWEKFSR